MFGRGKVFIVLARGLGDVYDILAIVRALMHVDGNEENCGHRERERGEQDEGAGAEKRADAEGGAEIGRLGLLSSPMLAAKVLQLGGNDRCKVRTPSSSPRLWEKGNLGNRGGPRAIKFP